MPRYFFRKNQKVKKKKHFDYIFSNASRIENSNIRIYFAPCFEKKGKVAVVASKKVGNAVKRNFCKRRLREIYRVNQYKIDNKYDLVLVSKRRILNQDFQTTFQSIMDLLNKNNLIVDNDEDFNNNN